MSYTRKQKKKLGFAAMCDRILGRNNLLSKELRAEVRRVEIRKRERRDQGTKP